MSSTANFDSFMSFVIANPNRTSSTIGSANSIAALRLSREICLNSFPTNAKNFPCYPSPLCAPRASALNTPSMSGRPNFFFNSSGVPSARIRPSTIIETLSQYSASSM